MEIEDTAECPFCLERMQLEDRAGTGWLVCPNGCPTEIEAPELKAAPKAPEAETTLSAIRPRAAGAA